MIRASTRPHAAARVSPFTAPDPTDDDASAVSSARIDHGGRSSRVGFPPVDPFFRPGCSDPPTFVRQPLGPRHTVTNDTRYCITRKTRIDREIAITPKRVQLFISYTRRRRRRRHRIRIIVLRAYGPQTSRASLCIDFCKHVVASSSSGRKRIITSSSSSSGKCWVV